MRKKDEEKTSAEENEISEKSENTLTYTIELPLQKDVVAKLIKELRKIRKYSQEGLGKLIGVQKAQVSKLEKGENNISLGTMIKIFKALNANVSFTVVVERKKYIKILEKIKPGNEPQE